GLSPNYLRPPPDLSMVGEAERHLLARALATRPEERWSSCRELMAELTRLTASAPAASRGGRGSERRRGERHRPHAGTSCRGRAALGKESWRATVLDLSVGGIRLLIARPNCRLEEGRKLSLVLLNKGRGFGRVVRMRVLHGTELPDGDHILGGTFDGAL